MTDFNSINNNFYILSQNISSQKADIVNPNAQNQPQGQNAAQAEAQIVQNTPMNPSLILNYENIKMDSEVVLKYLQNLMNLPDSIEKFISQINEPNSKIVEILIKDMISIKELGKFLNENSNTAIQKLLQTISTTLKSGIGDISQLREILGILNTIQSQSEISTNTLRELLLLYIPLNQPIFDKESSFDDITQEEKEKIKESALSILFETYNFSNILCTMNEIDNCIYINIYAGETFPNEKFTTIIERLSKEGNLTVSLEIKKLKENKSAANTQNFKILSDNFIPINMIILSHIVIKTILKIDNDCLST